MLGTPESERLKVTALNLWEASYLSFDRPLPGKPPKIPDRLSPFSKMGFFHITTQSPNRERKDREIIERELRSSPCRKREDHRVFLR